MTPDSTPQQRPSRARKLVGWVLLLSGAAVTLLALSPSEEAREGHKLGYAKIKEIRPGATGFALLETRFPVDRIDVLEVTAGDHRYTLNIAHYRGTQDIQRQAIVFPPDAAANSAGSNTLQATERLALRSGHEALRHELWQTTAETILKHTDPDALFLTWWDNAQRIHLLTGRESWTRSPDRDAFPTPQARALWQAAGGTFAKDDRGRDLARWFTMETKLALQTLNAHFPNGKPAFVLVTIHDLARLSEIASLSGYQMPLEAAIFAYDGNVHGLVPRVRQWANEGLGTGSYLVQRLSEQKIRAWRIMDKSAEDMLLIRLLPFTSSLQRTVESMPIVYQSGWGGYISIYRWRPDHLPKEKSTGSEAG